MKTIFLLAINFLVALSFSSCSSLYQDVTVEEVEKVIVRKLNDEQIILTADMRMNNPNWFDVNVFHSDLKVISNDKIIGTARILESVVVAGGTEATYRFVIETKFSKMVLKNLSEVMNLAIADSIQIRLRGTVTASALMFENSELIDIYETIKL